jgi:hypothetical protein
VLEREENLGAGDLGGSETLPYPELLRGLFGGAFLIVGAGVAEGAGDFLAESLAIAFPPSIAAEPAGFGNR